MKSVGIILCLVKFLVLIVIQLPVIMKPLVLNSFICLLFVELVFSFFYSQNLIIFESRLPITELCNETIYSDSIECIREAYRKYNITVGQENVGRNWCCAQWQLISCTIELVRINCTADDLESIQIQMNETQESLERYDCKEYPRYDDILCYDLPEFTSTEWLSTQETSESTFETQTSTTPSEMTTLVATTSSLVTTTDSIETTTGSLETTTDSLETTTTSSLETTTGSLVTTTSSLETTTGSLETTTGSLVTTTDSLETSTDSSETTTDSLSSSGKSIVNKHLL